MDEDGTPYGMWGDHCPECGQDFKAPHTTDCPRYHRREFLSVPARPHEETR